MICTDRERKRERERPDIPKHQEFLTRSEGALYDTPDDQYLWVTLISPNQPPPKLTRSELLELLMIFGYPGYPQSRPRIPKHQAILTGSEDPLEHLQRLLSLRRVRNAQHRGERLQFTRISEAFPKPLFTIESFFLAIFGVISQVSVA